MKVSIKNNNNKAQEKINQVVEYISINTPKERLVGELLCPEMFTFTIEELKEKVVFQEQLKETTYQRTLVKKHKDGLIEYFLKGLKEAVEGIKPMTFLSPLCLVKLPDIDDLIIVDGQHRAKALLELYELGEITPEQQIPIAYYELSCIDQARQLFKDLNLHGKKVSSNLGHSMDSTCEHTNKVKELVKLSGLHFDNNPLVEMKSNQCTGSSMVSLNHLRVIVQEVSESSFLSYLEFLHSNRTALEKAGFTHSKIRQTTAYCSSVSQAIPYLLDDGYTLIELQEKIDFRRYEGNPYLEKAVKKDGKGWNTSSDTVVKNVHLISALLSGVTLEEYLKEEKRLKELAKEELEQKRIEREKAKELKTIERKLKAEEKAKAEKEKIKKVKEIKEKEQEQGFNIDLVSIAKKKKEKEVTVEQSETVEPSTVQLKSFKRIVKEAEIKAKQPKMNLVGSLRNNLNIKF